MNSVRIGVHVHTAPDGLMATLESLQVHTAPAVQIVLLPDGPDAATSAALTNLAHLPRHGTTEPLGPAACFNRLAALRGDAEGIVLLESGVVVGPQWLDRLLAALAADPRNGLAGPSTNTAWNEQGAYPRAGGRPADVAATAGEAARRFGSALRTLEPLHSLADFCYAVRGDVLEAVGPADEGYGLGPCWEMDYNARAARAGFRGVWVCGAYVYRTPFTERRARLEAQYFEASKQRYQDKFCGRRLRGEVNAPYRSHCRGDACANFAPPARLCVSRRPAPDAVAPLAPTEWPMASCIMPTYNRRAFLPQAVRCFQRQDYPLAELIVVDDGTDAVADCLPQDPRIRYIRLDRRLTIGAKRNVACSHARGCVIVHWDDDDWYPSWRLRTQVAVLQSGAAEVCGSSSLYFYEAAARRAWRYGYTGTPGTWAAGSTLAYNRRFWERNSFPDMQVGEDASFLWNGRTTRLHDLDDPKLCVAMIHPGNSHPKQTSGSYWRPCPEAQIGELLGDDLPVYQAAAGGSPLLTAPSLQQSSSAPLISCIMPTFNRRPFIPLAVRAFQAQDYPNKELLVLDDGTEPVGDLCEGQSEVRYIRLSARLSIGAKRNLACAQAAGEIIAHWDDDDWYAPERLRYQAAPLLAGEADVSGLENAFVLQLPGGAFWKTQPALHKRMFAGDVHGGTLLFRKQLFQDGVRYPNANLAEDAELLRQALRRGRRLIRLPNNGVFVYMRHGTNAWQFEAGRFLDPAGWQPTRSPAAFSETLLSAYQAAASSSAPQRA